MILVHRNIYKIKKQILPNMIKPSNILNCELLSSLYLGIQNAEFTHAKDIDLIYSSSIN